MGKMRVSVDVCPICVRKVWRGDSAQNWKGRYYHVKKGCLEKAKEREAEAEQAQDAAKPQMKGTGGWGGGPFRYFSTQDPQAKKKDVDKYSGMFPGSK